MVYEWLCGRRPFDGPVLSIFYQHIHTPPPSLREQLPTISPPVEAVVLKALAKEPKQRFANVLSFATALNRAALLSDQSPPPLRPTLSTSHPLFLSPTDTNVSPNAVTEVD